jgi:hypothetical protein
MAHRNNVTQTDPTHFDPVGSKNMLLQNVKRPHSITTAVAIVGNNIHTNYCKKNQHTF